MNRFHTSGFLSPFGPKHLLEINGKIPINYSKIVIKAYNSDEVVTPAGFDEDKVPYFSDEFYQNLIKKHDKIIKYDKDLARNTFWFEVIFEN